MTAYVFFDSRVIVEPVIPIGVELLNRLNVVAHAGGKISASCALVNNFRYEHTLTFASTTITTSGYHRSR